MTLTQERLKSICHYDPGTGFFTATVRRSNLMPGTVLGTKDSNPKSRGRLQVEVDGKTYRLHRLAWLYMTGEWPEEEIDHENLDASDNRWDNLREATRVQNTSNTRRPITNRSGKKGVSWHKAAKKWQVHIKVSGNNMYLGLFDDLDAAHLVYSEAAIKHRGEFARME